MKRSPLKRSTKPLRRTPLARSTKPIPRKRAKRRRVVSMAAKPWREWYENGVLIRLVCNTKTAAGRERYNGIRDDMYERDHGICCGCKRHIAKGEETFEHSDGRGGGKRNDLAEYVKPNGEVVVNRVMHLTCNGAKGSRRVA